MNEEDIKQACVEKRKMDVGYCVCSRCHNCKHSNVYYWCCLNEFQADRWFVCDRYEIEVE